MKPFILLGLLCICLPALATDDELLGVIDEIGPETDKTIVIDGKHYVLPEKMLVSVSGHDSIPVAYLKLGLNVLFTLGSDSQGADEISSMEVIGPAENVRVHFLEKSPAD